MKKSLFALAMGTFCLGITEFVMMAILPNVAHDFGISIPKAGNLISAYALGVCFGAPTLLMLSRTWPLKRILVLLELILIAASVSMAASTSYETMIVSRFVAGLPHGAFFGVGAIVADRLSKEGKSTFAVAIMSSGMTVANLIGIPLGTWLGEIYSWRLVFIMSAVCGICTLMAILRWMPYLSPVSSEGFKSTFRFLKHLAPWLIIICTLTGNCGIFAYYSYIAPLLINVTGIDPSLMTTMMVISGAGMVIGNMLGGKLSDVIGPGHSGLCSVTVMAFTLVVTFFFAQIWWVAIPVMMLCTAALFSASPPQQLLLLRYSKGGELLGGAMVQIAFNLGNAIGAFAGGVPITMGMSFEYTAAVGIVFVCMAIISYSVFIHRYEKANV